MKERSERGLFSFNCLLITIEIWRKTRRKFVENSLFYCKKLVEVSWVAHGIDPEEIFLSTS